MALPGIVWWQREVDSSLPFVAASGSEGIRHVPEACHEVNFLVPKAISCCAQDRHRCLSSPAFQVGVLLIEPRDLFFLVFLLKAPAMNWPQKGHIRCASLTDFKPAAPLFLARKNP